LKEAEEQKQLAAQQKEEIEHLTRVLEDEKSKSNALALVSFHPFRFIFLSCLN